MSVGGTAATSVTVVSSTSITATTAAHAPGIVDVVVTNSDTTERNVDARIHLHDSIQSGADGDRDLAQLRTCQWWNSGQYHRYGLPGGIDGERGRDSGHGRDGGEQHLDHSNHSLACRRYGERSGDEQRRAKWHSDQWLYLYFHHSGLGSQRTPGRFKFGHCSCRTNRLLHSFYRRHWDEWDSFIELHWRADGCKLLNTSQRAV